MANEQIQKSNDFGSMLNEQVDRLRTSFEPGEKITGVVTAVDPTGVFVDINARSEGIINREELVDEEGELTVQPGEEIEAYFLEGTEDEFRLTTRITGGADTEVLWNAYQSGIPVEGRVEAEINGGYEVQVSGHRGFCPYSQMDLHRQEPALYLNQQFLFAILEFDEHRGDLVLSRRQYLEREREKQREELRERLTEGEMVEGEVTKLMPFGAFVDLGGIDGLIPIGELAWGHTDDPADVVSVGDRVKVLVRQIDWGRERISLSLRQASGDPWMEVDSKYHVGQRVGGKVVRLMPFGAFVELEPGVDGLVHISKFGTGRRINHPKEVVSPGDIVEVAIERVDTDERRIGLSMENAGPGAVGAAFPEDSGTVEVGSTVTGVVDGVKDFGVFVNLPDGRTGLLHVSEVDLGSTRDPEGALRNRFPVGEQVKVAIKKIDGDRIGLGLPGDGRGNEGEEGGDVRKYMNDSTDSGLGSIGDALSGLDL